MKDVFLEDIREDYEDIRHDYYESLLVNITCCKVFSNDSVQHCTQGLRYYNFSLCMYV